MAVHKKTIIVWFRNDLRVSDHPALARACKDGDYVIPLFIFDPAIINGPHAGSNRTRFLLECLEDLKQSLKNIGADLIIRHGHATTELQKIIKEMDVNTLYYTADYSPFAVKRDKKIHELFEKSDIDVRSFSGRLIVSTMDAVKTKTGTPHKVFTPYYRAWSLVERRALAPTPTALSLPPNITLGALPKLTDVTTKSDLSSDVAHGGETEAKKKLYHFLNHGVDAYADQNNDLGSDGTSRLSAYFHFGCLSPLDVENQLSDSTGAQAWRRQLAWRDFYHYTLFYNPSNSTQEYQEKYRRLTWRKSQKDLEAWQQGQTGYPVVDAAMRQLNLEGWMHNRGRLIVGSFLTKDLWLNWREGESYFMRMLLDGDQANNNGNWQWIASVGVDPAPVYRRLYNPSSQQKNYDPSGSYVRQFCPELKLVPDKFLAEPWNMSEEQQREANCIIGKDYPAPIVDHKAARVAALEQYRSV